jgi:plasmid stabilization system protein ParE
LKVRYHPEARVELEAAVDWYEDQQPGLGEDMDREIQRAEAVIAESPSAWGHWPGTRSVRRFILSRFPYSVVYRVHGMAIEVIAIAHHHREPGYWKGRVSGAPRGNR